MTDLHAPHPEHDHHGEHEDHDHPETPLRPVPGLTRRRALSLAGAGAAAFAAGGGLRLAEDAAEPDPAAAAVASCALTPDKTEGPYFVDEGLNRSDIRVDTSTGTAVSGTPVRLTIVAVRADGSCGPVAGAMVDVWHAAADGSYSDVSQNGTVGKKYLRGYQLTDADGQATFTTIFPGWYSGRAVHIHFKIRTFSGSTQTSTFTSQLFFDPSVTSSVLSQGAYASRGQPDTSNASDGIYGSDGASLVVPLSGSASAGFTGTFVAGLDGLPTESTTTDSSGATTGDTTSSSGGTSTSTAQDEVLGSVLRARWRRLASGRRVLRLTLDLDERITVVGRMSRSGRTIVRRKRSKVRAGTRALELPVPMRTVGGRARVTLSLTDGSGTAKVVRRTVRVPRRGRTT